MDKEHFLQSKTFRGILCGLGIAAVGLVIFIGGMSIGARRAYFACKWGENYGRSFGEHVGSGRGGMMGSNFDGGRMGGFHGVLGSIVSASDDGIVVKGKDGVERSVIIAAQTDIRRGADSIAKADLKPGDQVMTFGEPNDDGRIAARLIRVLTAQQQP
jgi:hypothetical protein